MSWVETVCESESESERENERENERERACARGREKCVSGEIWRQQEMRDCVLPC